MDIMLERILLLIPRKENGDFVHGALKDFAENIGLKSGNLISDWIAGRSKSYIKKIHEISSKYNVSVEWLKGETDQKEKPALENEDGLSNQIKYVIKIMEQMPLEDQEKLVEALKIMGKLPSIQSES